MFLVASLVLSAAESSAANKIEAVKGKAYKLTKQHGPWMIMVCSFQRTPEEFRTEGMSPEEAASELVFELRQKGIPAYAFAQPDRFGDVDTHNRLGLVEERQVLANHGGICVLAGNFPTLEDDKAQKTLAAIKKFHPTVLTGVEKDSPFVKKLKNGGIYRITSDQPNPLGGAFLTTNPLLTPEEARQARRDPLLIKLNSGVEYSVLENPGKYTLTVASFYGKPGVTKVEGGRFDEAMQKFKVTDTLDQAANNAMELCRAMRQRDIEAYVYHDRYSSVVTIGAFASATDPGVAKYQQMFGSKTQQHPTTGQMVQTAESFTVPAKIPPGGRPDKAWIFDPQPRLIEVPTLGSRK